MCGPVCKILGRGCVRCSGGVGVCGPVVRYWVEVV